MRWIATCFFGRSVALVSCQTKTTFRMEEEMAGRVRGSKALGMAPTQREVLSAMPPSACRIPEPKWKMRKEMGGKTSTSALIDIQPDCQVFLSSACATFSALAGAHFALLFLTGMGA